MAERRSNYWDNIKGILIILVVFAHFLYAFTDIAPIGAIVRVIYVFHMPAFVFVSGYFSKSERSRSGDSLLKLAAAYLFFNALFMLIALIKGESVNLITPYYSMWYLLSLISWRLIMRILPKKRYLLILSLIFALLVGFFPDVENGLSLRRTAAFFPFFLFGFFFDDAQNSFRRMKRGLKCLTGLIGIPCLLLVSHYFITAIGIGLNSLLMTHYLSFVELIIRVLIFALAFFVIVLLLTVSPERKLPFVTKAGRNSLAIYLTHRYLTLLYQDVLLIAFPELLSAKWLILFSALLTVAVILFFGSDRFSVFLNRALSNAVSLLKGRPEKGRPGLGALLCIAMLICVLVFPALVSAKEWRRLTDTQPDPIYPVMNDNELAAYDDAFRLVFAGDLILLEDQVKRAYGENGYDFSPMFEYTGEYIASADLAVGVLEGPLGGPEIGWSCSNFDDGKELALNYPDEFAEAIQEAGFDIVTTANNHLLDKGEAAAFRTLDVLDGLGLSHICAMTADDYIAELAGLSDLIRKANPDAGLVFIAPWTSIDGDPYTDLSYAEKTDLNGQYTDALKNWCQSEGFTFIDANPFIEDALMRKPSSFYLIDHIHPNSTAGIRLYSEAVMTYR